MVRTIGVAVEIPEPWRTQLDRHRAASGDPLAPLIPAHLTLLGPTEVDDSSATSSRVTDHLSAVAAGHQRFSLGLRGTGTFRPITQVVFVAVASGARECSQLAADIRSGPLAKTLPYGYHPHVTVAHDVPPEALDAVDAALASFEARFPIEGFTLYQHGADGRWHRQREFTLNPR